MLSLGVTQALNRFAVQSPIIAVLFITVAPYVLVSVIIRSTTLGNSGSIILDTLLCAVLCVRVCMYVFYMCPGPQQTGLHKENLKGDYKISKHKRKC